MLDGTAMLIPADVMNKCLRCRAELAAGDETCPKCGADPALERQIWVQTTAAVRELRWVFLAALVLNGVVTWLVYDHLHRNGFTADASQVAIAGGIVCAGAAALWLAAPRVPVIAAVIGIAIFGLDWGREILRDHVWALDPSPSLGLRIAVMSALVFALRRGLAASKLRAQRREAPRATAANAA
jgi:hypothetical protein